MTLSNLPGRSEYRPVPPLAAAHFVTGIAWLVAGVGLGIYMSVAHDFLLKPVHAHANLLGWATNALFGSFYWLRGGVALRREWLGYVAFNLGGLSLLAGVTAILIYNSPPSVAMPIGAGLVAFGVLQMAATIVGAVAKPSRELVTARG